MADALADAMAVLTFQIVRIEQGAFRDFFLVIPAY